MKLLDVALGILLTCSGQPDFFGGVSLAAPAAAFLPHHSSSPRSASRPPLHLRSAGNVQSFSYLRALSSSNDGEETEPSKDGADGTIRDDSQFFADNDCLDLCEVSDEDASEETTTKPSLEERIAAARAEARAADAEARAAAYGPTATNHSPPDTESSHLYADEDCQDLCNTMESEEKITPLESRNEIDEYIASLPEEMRKRIAAARAKVRASDARKATEARDHPTKETGTLSSQTTSKSSNLPSNPSKHRSNLELHWQVSESSAECDLEEIESCSEPCKDCGGSGKIECRFCGGTGFFTMGEQLLGGGKACPICNDGEQCCKGCRGSGWVASWRSFNLTNGT